MSRPNCLIVYGERSGEQHFESLYPFFPTDWHLWGIGNSQNTLAPIECLFDYHSLSAIGIANIFFSLPRYQKILKILLNEVEKRQTTRVFLIDFQEFNYNLAFFLKKRFPKLQICLYGAPQAWAWRQYRAKKLSKRIDLLLCFLPFEKQWFGEQGFTGKIIQVPHFLWKKFFQYSEQIKRASLVRQERLKNPQTIKTILILLGSRSLEIEKHIGAIKDLVKFFPKFCKGPVRWIGILPEHYDGTLFEKKLGIDFFSDKVLEEKLLECDFAIASSGTVTLQLGLWQIPSLVMYAISPLNAWIYRSVIKYEGFLSLTNILLEKEIFPEITQESVFAYSFLRYLKEWLEVPEIPLKKIEELRALSLLLSGEQEYEKHLNKEFFQE